MLIYSKNKINIIVFLPLHFFLFTNTQMSNKKNVNKNLVLNGLVKIAIIQKERMMAQTTIRNF